MTNFNIIVNTFKSIYNIKPNIYFDNYLSLSILIFFKSYILEELNLVKSSIYLKTLLLWQEFHSLNDETAINVVFAKSKLEQIGEFHNWLKNEKKQSKWVSLKHIYNLIKLESIAINFTVIDKINQSKNNANKEFYEEKKLSKDATISISSPDGKNIIETKLSDMELDWDELNQDMGLKAYEPISISNTFHKGYLYYPLESLITIKDKDKEGQIQVMEKIETIVVRSDRSILRASASPLPDESKRNQQVYRLSDGTLIQSLPKPNKYSTWRWNSINEFISGEDEEESLIELLQIVHDHFYAQIWLPNENDYWLIALGMTLTYVQSVFDAVPLFLITGPAGSGKSQLGAAMASISSNVSSINQTSAATMMRTMDEAGGLAIFDDLESIGINKGRKNQEKFSEIAQVLKISYKKASASKMVMNQSTMRSEKLNFFGVKVINNTRGADAILSSRMIEINTQHIPENQLKEFTTRTSISEEILEQTRDKLHTWAFTNVNKVHELYVEKYQSHGKRSDEIASPLRVLAELSDDQFIIDQLELSLELQERKDNINRSPNESLQYVIEKLIKEGYRKLSITHIMLELRHYMDPGYKIDYISSMPGWSKSIWIGRALREMSLIVPDFNSRKRLHNSNLRLVKINNEIIKRILSKETNNEMIEELSPVAFCTECEQCKYKMYQCELKGKRKISF